MALFIPTYFSPISQYGVIFNSNSLEFEVEDNFQKQTYRSRCYIYGANGKQLLNIPIRHQKNGIKQKSKDVLIEEGSRWQKQHFKSMKIAYSSSPFFEFYEDDLLPIFNKNYKYLLDLSMDTFQFVNTALDLNKSFSITKEYKDVTDLDFRKLANVKPHLHNVHLPYTQVFDTKYGHIENLSILDLIFMEGPNSISFLEKVTVTLE